MYSVRIKAEAFGPLDGVRLVVPVIADRAKVYGGPTLNDPKEIFFLAGGFSAREFVLTPDAFGKAWIQIKI